MDEKHRITRALKTLVFYTPSNFFKVGTDIELCGGPIKIKHPEYFEIDEVD